MTPRKIPILRRLLTSLLDTCKTRSLATRWHEGRFPSHKHMIAGRGCLGPESTDSGGNQDVDWRGFRDSLARCTTERDTPRAPAASRTDK